MRPESLPDDVAAAAAQLARSGNLIGALSLLYRGALVTLLHRDRIELVSGDTEADCLTKTRSRLAAPTYAYLARLLSAWQAAAYAHRMPPQPEVEQLASEWPAFFRAGARVNRRHAAISLLVGLAAVSGRVLVHAELRHRARIAFGSA